MSNVKTVIEDFSVKDLEDNSTININVLDCTELGNEGKPGIQVCYMGRIINVSPSAAERWEYQANKAGVAAFLLEEHSWMAHDDQFVKVYFLTGEPLKVKVEVKTRSSKLISKEYPLPFKTGE